MTRLGPRGGVRAEFELACRRVILPVMRVTERTRPVLGRPPAGTTSDDAVHDGQGADDLLVLTHGHTGATDLHDWWLAERSAVFRGSHDVAVVVLSDDGHPVTTWAFTGCHLVALRYSPLDAVAGDILMETADLSFEAVGQISHR